MYKATVENRGEAKYYATTRHASFVLGTEGDGASPIDALLAALCSCMGHYVRDYLLEQQLAPSGFTIVAEAGVTPDKSRLTEIRVRIDLQGIRLDEQQQTALLAIIENCKVHRLLCTDPGVITTLIQN